MITTEVEIFYWMEQKKLLKNYTNKENSWSCGELQMKEIALDEREKIEKEENIILRCVKNSLRVNKTHWILLDFEILLDTRVNFLFLQQ